MRWIRSGTVASSLISPLADHLTETYNMSVLGGAFVTQIEVQDSDSTKQRAHAVRYRTGKDSEETTLADLDGVVLALGSKGMKAVVGGSPGLAQYEAFSRAASLSGEGGGPWLPETWTAGLMVAAWLRCCAYF